MHRTGHWMGMDVHDCGGYVEPSEIGTVNERKDPLSGEIIKDRPSRILQPGMVLTIEPGLYIAPDDTSVAAKWRGIGIRIEDDVLITANGHRVLTDVLERGADEVEALMAR